MDETDAAMDFAALAKKYLPLEWRMIVAAHSRAVEAATARARDRIIDAIDAKSRDWMSVGEYGDARTLRDFAGELRGTPKVICAMVGSPATSEPATQDPVWREVQTASGYVAPAPAASAPATSSAERQHQHHLPALNAAGWALLSFAASPHDGLGHRAAAAMGLSDGLSGRPCWPAHKDAVEIEAYRMGHRAGLVVRTGSAT